MILMVMMLSFPGATIDVDRDKLAPAAESLVGLPYDLGGRHQLPAKARRKRKADPPATRRGVDCQAVVFYALERAATCGWRSYSVMPQESIVRGELGDPVFGAAPARTEFVDVATLEPGDIIYLLGPTPNDNEKASVLIEAVPHWTWHMGMFVGDGRFVHADFFTGEVKKHHLRAYLFKHRDMFTGVYVVRPHHVKPKRCRKHDPMPDASLSLKLN